MASTNTLANLISRVALRDRASFRLLYAQTSAKLFGVVLRLLQNRAEAEDALQEIFVKIWERAPQFRETESSPVSWLVTIARNHAIDMIRGRKGVAVELDDELGLADAGPDPERAAIQASTARQIESCLAELETAEAIRGAYLDGFSYQELAERFNVPINTMRTWLRRGLLKLRECLERSHGY